MKFILTGGGTGGHVYPAIAIADELKTRYPQAGFLYVGVRGRAEEKIVPEHGYEIRYVNWKGFRGGKPGLRTMASLVRLGFSLVHAAVIHLGYRPDGVIGTGGYASVPAVLAAVLLRRLGLSSSRVVIHEQNFAPGRWNRLIARWADRVWVSFEGSASFFRGARVELTGYPIRRQILPLDRNEARDKLSIPRDAKVLMVFGGSQGARSINRALVEALPALLDDPKVIVLHGSGTLVSGYYNAAEDTTGRVAALGLDKQTLERYRRQDYFQDIQTYYAAADLVVCRGGAGTLSELSRCGRAALIIPKSNLAGEHQAVNALELARTGAAEIVFERPDMVAGTLQAAASGKTLAKRALRLLDNPERIRKMETAALALSSRNVMENFTSSVEAELSGSRLARQYSSAPGGPGQAGEWTDPSRLAYLSSSQVVAFARKAVLDRDPVGFEQDPLIETLRYFADCYLVSPRWQVSNNGVKLVGILQYHQRRGLLLAMAGDRSRAPFLKRLIGGDFRQVGFIRRNALLALAGLGEWDENLRDLLLLVLNNDPYYESRTAAAEVIIQLREKIGSSQALTQAIEANLRHRSLEVRCRALEALGAVTDDPELMPGTNLESFLFHPNWRIRQALARAARHMLERGLVQPSDPLVRQLENIIPTCTDFVPTYPLKHSLNRLRSFSSDDCDCTGPSDGKGPT